MPPRRPVWISKTFSPLSAVYAINRPSGTTWMTRFPPSKPSRRRFRRRQAPASVPSESRIPGDENSRAAPSGGVGPMAGGGGKEPEA